MDNSIETFPRCKDCKYLIKMYYFQGSHLKNINYLCDVRYNFASDCKYWELNDTKLHKHGMNEILVEMKEELSNIESILLANENKNAPN